MPNLALKRHHKKSLTTMLAATTAFALVFTLADPTMAAEDASLRTVSEAASAYDANDPKSIAALAEAASPINALTLSGTDNSSVSLTESGAFVSVDEKGVASLSGVGSPEISIGVASPNNDSTLTEGVSVQRNAAPGTNIVTRATANGAQLIAVLEDSQASSSLDFDLDLPADAELVENPDGSVAIVADVEIVTPVDESFDATSAQIESILGDTDDPEEITQEQWDQIEALPEAETQTTIARQQIALIETPWAVDAEGEHLKTRFVLNGNGLTQIIETNEQTAFPVTADPSLAWWLWTGATCAANLATILFGAAKLVQAITKMNALVKKSAKLSAAVKKLGGAKKFLTAIYKAAKGFVEGKIGKYLTRTQMLALSSIGSGGLALVGDALGIGSCISLIKAKL
ncbi:hypothetical protein CQ018_18925 [Arthrobacter sp. MYb227]|uniref:hypothetical protein n=1 Tax=Arthrobacter sp. MYb227 TaxID=1848601 RepID=UPI000CFCCE44|nr:hypothetical protein [Arthrobacter sp. MYb227]PQZ86432.1 hypothetical protein CQ018_18925 [Arthrobacter sp. MYb227]